MAWGYTHLKIFQFQKKYQYYYYFFYLIICIITENTYLAHIDVLFKQINLLKRQDRIELQLLKFITTMLIITFFLALSFKPTVTATIQTGKI